MAKQTELRWVVVRTCRHSWKESIVEEFTTEHAANACRAHFDDVMNAGSSIADFHVVKAELSWETKE